jgi:hypothetical protein
MVPAAKGGRGEVGSGRVAARKKQEQGELLRLLLQEEAGTRWIPEKLLPRRSPFSRNKVDPGRRRRSRPRTGGGQNEGEE